MKNLATHVAICLLPFIAITSGNICPGKQTYACKSQKQIIVSGMEFDCAGDTICNKAFVEPCTPCVPRMCDDAFVCTNPSQSIVSISNQDFECPNHYSCNKDMEDPCPPCVLSTCDGTANYECDSTDKTIFKVAGMTVDCEAGKICNEKFRYPCEPCSADPALAPKTILKLRPIKKN